MRDLGLWGMEGHEKDFAKFIIPLKKLGRPIDLNTA